MAKSLVKLWSKPPSERIDQKDWSPELKRIVAGVKNFGGCNSNSLRIYQREKNIILIAKFPIPLAQNPKESRINKSESIAFVFKEGYVSVHAPQVYSNRTDFPRDLPHLNPVLDEEPAYICLSNVGLSDAYRQHGIRIIVKQLSGWLKNASSGDLNRDGWHPVPTMYRPQQGIINLAKLQDDAFKQKSSPSPKYGVAETHPHLVAKKYGRGYKSKIHLFNNIDGDIFLKEPPEPKKEKKYSPVIFLVSKDTYEKPIFSYVSTGQGIFNILKKAKMDSSSFTIITSGYESFIQLLKDNNLRLGIIIIGIWRPNPMQKNAIGLSENEEARKLEIKAYEISTKQLTDKHNEDYSLWSACEIEVLPVPSKKIFQKVSGQKYPQNVHLIGYGALGSEIFDFLVRSGTPKIKVIDPDSIEAHNLTRHTATYNNLLSPKVIAAKCYSYTINAGTDIVENYGYFQEKKGQKLQKYDLILDATANSFLREHLSFKMSKPLNNITRIEIFDDGRLGFLSVAGSKNTPDLHYLYSYLCHLGIRNQQIQEWIIRENKQGEYIKSIEIGMTCASPSVVLPKETIAVHAATFMPKLREVSKQKGKSSAGIGINPLNEDGTPIGWQWFDVAPPKTHIPDGAKGWKIRINPSAIKKMKKWLKEKCPNETGGFLYGVQNLGEKIIDVMIATPEPEGTVGTPTALELKEKGTTDIEKCIDKNCSPRIHFLGSWHSHPNGGHKMSKTDKETFNHHHEENKAQGLPTLMIITTKNKLGVYLKD